MSPRARASAAASPLLVLPLLLLFCAEVAECAAGKLWWNGDEMRINCGNDTLEEAAAHAQAELGAHPPAPMLLLDSCPPPVAGGYAALVRGLVARGGSLQLRGRTRGLHHALRDDMLQGLPARLQLHHYNSSQFLVKLTYPYGAVNLYLADELEIWCEEATLELQTLADQTGALLGAAGLRARNFTLRECSPPRTSYTQVLSTLGVSVEGVERLRLRDLWTEPRLAPAHFQNLSLQHFQMNYHQLEFAPKNKELKWTQLGAAGTVPSLALDNVLFAPLPDDNLLEQVRLSHGRAQHRFGGCVLLRRLELVHWWIPKFGLSHDDWYLRKCSQLQELVVEEATAPAVETLLAQDMLRSLRSLTLRDCELTRLDASMFYQATELTHLDISDNPLTVIHTAVLSRAPTLASLVLARNRLRGKELAPVLAYAKIKNLERLVLDDNPLFSADYEFCENFELQHQAPRLRELSLQRTGLTGLCFGFDFGALRRLRLAGNNVTYVEMTGLPSPDGHSVEVDLQGNPIDLLSSKLGYSSERQCALKEARLAHLGDKRNVTILLDLSLDCDCQYGCAAAQHRELRRTAVSGAWCTARGVRFPLGSVHAPHVARVSCERGACGACTCRRAWDTNRTAADCAARALRLLPDELADQPLLTTLHAADNRIDTLREQDLPDTLIELDLRNNTVLSLSREAASRLFSVARNISLAGTSVPCRCPALPWLQALTDNKHMIWDFEAVKCEGSEVPLWEVRLSELCAEVSAAWPPVAGAALALAMLAAATLLYCRFTRHIKVFLFARGWCLSCVTEHDAEPDREYDAFLSFCHKDDEFVTQNILPELGAYSLCIHYRDWAAGGWIPEQIARSVQRSRRTLIVLSNEFLNSQWSLLEFRMAHAITLEEKRSRIIVIVIGDVLSDGRIDAELRSYLATNTYVKWGDPWFFDKLRYALPNKMQSVPPESPAPPVHVQMNNFRLALETYRTDDNNSGTHAT